MMYLEIEHVLNTIAFPSDQNAKFSRLGGLEMVDASGCNLLELEGQLLPANVWRRGGVP